MPKCKKIRGQRRRVCIGDLNKLVTINNRVLQAPKGQSPDYTLLFTEDTTINPGIGDLNEGEVFAMIKTVNGETIFDGNNIERDVTHHVYIVWGADVTAEDWITFENDRYDVLNVEDLDEEHEFLLLRCTNRGLESNSNTAA